MGYLISAWNESKQKPFVMSLKQVVSIAGDGSLENDDSIHELREFFGAIDLKTMERLLGECYSKEKKDKFDTRGFAFQDLINEMGSRLGYQVEHGLYRGKKNELGFDGLWKSEDGSYIIMESKTSDDYSIAIESVAGYRDKLISENKISKKKCSILIVFGRDEKGGLSNTAKGSDDAKNIRLISANALFQMVKLYSESSSIVIKKQISSLLQPKDYFVLDNLVELVFPQTDADIPEILDVDDDDAKDVKSINEKEDSNYSGEVTLVPSLPTLPDEKMKTGAFIKQAMINLSESGFVFNDEEMRALCEENSMHNVVGLSRHLPFFKKYNEADTKGHLIAGRPRFYRDPLKFGDEIVYLNSQVYDYDKDAFIKWYLRHKSIK